MVRRVVVAVFPELQILDLTGPLEVFSTANRRAGGDEYALEVVSSDGTELQASCGLRVVPERPVPACRGPIDTLMVVGGPGTARAVADEVLVSWVRNEAQHARRVVSVCSGAFVLARAGVLDGRSVTTHWSVCNRLGDLYPRVAVEPDPLFVCDGNRGHITIMDLNGNVLSTFGKGGRQPGQFYEAHQICVDSNGVLYEADASGKRVQRFVPQ